MWGRGVYREVVPPERLVYADSFADAKGNPVSPATYGMSPGHPFETLVTVTFTEHDGKTTVTLRQAVYKAVPERAGMEQGWTEMLDRLADELRLVPQEDAHNRPPHVATQWSAWASRLQSVLRIVAAAMFIQAGTMKLFAFPAGIPPSAGTVPVISQLGLASILEAFGGALLLVGLFTRPVAFLVAGEMAVAYFQVSFPQGFWPILNGGVDAALYCFIWLYFSAAGAGPWSLDARRSPKPSWAASQLLSRG